MNKVILFCLAVVLLVAASAIAADKVVVIPLNSSQHTTCTAPDEVLSLGKCWKDRNLGANQVATLSDDPLAYGDLYQWGRPRDGHHHSDSLVASPENAYDDPPHGTFITKAVSPFDWRDPQNDNLWQGLGGINNPCPQGFRLPTKAEFEAERSSWANKNAAGAFESPLKLPAAGYRTYNTGSFQFPGVNGYYWTSSISTTKSSALIFGSGATIENRVRAYGYSVRCLKD